MKADHRSRSAQICCVLFWAAAARSAHAQTQQTSAPQVALQGRFSPGAGISGYASLPQVFSWPASSAFFSIEGATSATINLAAIPQQTNLTYSINWFRFFVDGQPAADGFTSYNQLALSVTLNVTNSGHTVRITKMNDGAKGEASLQSISLNGSGRFLQPTGVGSQASRQRMLILGDSYAVGYGNAGAAIPGTCQPNPQQLPRSFQATCDALKIVVPQECADLWQVFNENSLEAFGPVAAEALGADYQVIATSGSGLVGYSYAAESHPDLPPELYEAILPSNQAMLNRSVYANASSQYNLTSWVPQVVLVTSGTNDWHSVPPLYTLEDWLTDATAFLAQVSATFGQPAIVIQAWPPEQQLAGALDGPDGINETIQYIQAMPSLYTQAVEQQIPNVHYLQLDTRNYDNYFAWCDGHPSAAADRAIAAQIVEFISAVVPGWNASSPVSLRVDQQAIRPSAALYDGAAPGPAFATAG